MEEFTDWFDKSVTPLHVGVYEVLHKPNGAPLFRWFSYWTGKHWCYTAQTPENADACRHMPSREARRQGGFKWRGVVRKKF